MAAKIDNVIIVCKPTHPSKYISDDDGSCIMFLPCGVLSFNRNDVEQRYCAMCHRFIQRSIDP